uniref:HA domain-containing protein n=1 Tax=Panagrellus redivivus TaxID=6233 RepID=A0A7E4UYE4_PANRE
MFQPVEFDINRPVDFESGLNSTDKWVSNLLPKPFMRRKHMKKLGLVKHANFYKCLSDEDKTALNNFTIETTPSCTINNVSKASERRPNSALLSTNEQIEKVASDFNKRPKSAEPAVSIYWHTKRYLQKVSLRKKYEELQYVDIEAMGFKL